MGALKQQMVDDGTGSSSRPVDMRHAHQKLLELLVRYLVLFKAVNFGVCHQRPSLVPVTYGWLHRPSRQDSSDSAERYPRLSLPHSPHGRVVNGQELVDLRAYEQRSE